MKAKLDLTADDIVFDGDDLRFFGRVLARIWETRSPSLERFPRCEGNDLNLVSIRISDEGTIIVGAVVFTNTGRPLVNRTIRNGAFMETSYCLPVRCLKRDVNTVAGSCGQAIDRAFRG